MTVAAQLPRRQVDADCPLPSAGPARFTTNSDTVAASQVATDMGDLAHRVRSLMALQNGHVAQLPLGGRFFDIVITANGPDAYGAVRELDSIQHSGNERADACGPVIEDTRRGWYIWLVPPGTSDTWTPNRYAVCLGRPYSLSLPAMTAAEPPGPYWLRPCRGDRLVPPTALRDLLDQFRPGPVPHETLLGSVLSTP
ncbi:hypothetical protein AB0958_36365 [Streptomyces sp. NPDC006655]|uniref:hypothetical protein n=1 Tax=Streptomyces sp. NPDC006655 TaxID=3156898 RepID=UPI003454311C